LEGGVLVFLQGEDQNGLPTAQQAEKKRKERWSVFTWGPREDPKNGCRRCHCTVGVHHGPVDTAGSRSLPLLSPFLLLLYNIYIYKLPKHLKVSL
jgi:hypothetical protein